MSKTGIYKIQSIIYPNRCYIGSAVNIKERWKHHLLGLKSLRHPNRKLQNHYNKYGSQDLSFSVLIFCDRSDLIEHEQFFIDAYNPWFNICKIANNKQGVKTSQETREKQRLARLGFKDSDETRLKKSIAQKNRKKQPTPKGSIPWNKGLTKETDDRVKRNIEKTTISLKGKTPWNKGRIGCFSEESRKKMSDHMKNRIPWNKNKKGCYSEESLKKMRKPKKKNR